MEKQYCEVEKCKNGFLGLHKFDAITKQNGVIVWECSLCGVTRGVCRHDIGVVELPKFDREIGTDQDTFYFCSHCHQQMEALTIKVDELPEDAPDPCSKEYEKYLTGQTMDPRD